MFDNVLYVTKPIIILTLTGLITLLLEVLSKKSVNKKPVYITAFGGLFYTLYTISDYILNFEEELIIFSGSLKLDEFSLGIAFVLVLGALLVVLLSYYSFGDSKRDSVNFCSLMLFGVVGMVSLVFSNDMFTFFISFEVMSVSVYILSGFDIKDFRSNEAGIKYLILGAFATAFLILGIAFLYGSSGQMVFDKIVEHYSNNILGDDELYAYLGLGLVLIGFLFKVGAVPFHQWMPDAYEGAPTVVTAFMSTCVKVAAFGIMFRSLFSFFRVLDHEIIIDILIAVSVLTVVVGNFLALVQNNIKRIIAFSGIGHTGYILIYLVAGLKSDIVNYNPLLFYLLSYVIINVGVFASLLNLSEQTLVGIRGLGYRNRFLGLSMSVFLFSLAGMPLTSGFMGKFFIFKYALSEELYMLSIIGILSAVVSFYYYLRIIVYMYLKDEGYEYPILKARWSYILVALIGVVLTLSLGIYPDIGFYFLLGY